MLNKIPDSVIPLLQRSSSRAYVCRKTWSFEQLRRSHFQANNRFKSCYNSGALLGADLRGSGGQKATSSFGRAFQSPRRLFGNVPRNDNILPPLMENVRFYWWSSFFSRLKMWFQIKFTIKKIDPEFDVQDFLAGAHRALTVVSTKLANKDYQGLEQYIEPSALSEIKRNLVRFTDAQRQALKVTPQDAYVCFPHHIRVRVPHRSSHAEILKVKSTAPFARIVEIVVVFHIWRGTTIEELRKRSLRKMLQSDVDSFMICNYTFERDYSEPHDSFWDITSLVYFCSNPSKGTKTDGDTTERKPRRRSRQK